MQRKMMPVLGLAFLVIVIQSMLFADKSNTSDAYVERKIKECDEEYKPAGSFELGGAFGMPSGLNMRFWFTDYFGLESTLGFSFDRKPIGSLDFIIQHVELYRAPSWKLQFFYGCGGLVTRAEEISYHVRAPFGFSMPIIDNPLRLSITAAPAYILAPERKFAITWWIGFRYDFGMAAAIQEQQNCIKRKMYRMASNVDNLKLGLDRAQGKLKSTMDELDDIKGKLKIVKTDLEGTKSELSNIKSKFDNTKNMLDETKRMLSHTKSELDGKQQQLENKQRELNNTKLAVEQALKGSEKKDEERKIAKLQEELNDQRKKLQEERIKLQQRKQEESKHRNDLKEKCESRRGIINEAGYCSCKRHERWNHNMSSCVCIKGYYLDKKNNQCEPCPLITYNGFCASSCKPGEVKVRLQKGSHTFVCVQRCRKPNHVWSHKKNLCVCQDGYYLSGDSCVPRN